MFKRPTYLIAALGSILGGLGAEAAKLAAKTKPITAKGYRAIRQQHLRSRSLYWPNKIVHADPSAFKLGSIERARKAFRLQG